MDFKDDLLVKFLDFKKEIIILQMRKLQPGGFLVTNFKKNFRR